MKKIIPALIVFLILLSIFNISYATDFDGIIKSGDSFLEKGRTESGGQILGLDLNGVANASDLIFNALIIAATIIIVCVGSILGIKYMAASVEGQAKIKESLVPFVVGSVVIYGSIGIWRLITGILETMVGN